MSIGAVKWSNAETGSGAIVVDRELQETQRVEFDIVQDNKGPQAEAVRPV